MAWRFRALGGVEEEKPTLSFREIISNLIPFLKPYRLYLLAYMLATMIYMATRLSIPFITGLLIDSIVGNNLSQLIFFSILFLCAIGLNWVLGFARTYLSTYTGQSFIRDLRKRLLNTILNAELSEIHGGEVGRIVSRITNDVDTIVETFTSGVLEVISDILIILLALALMFFLSPQLSIAVMPLIPALLIINFYFAKRARRAFRRARRAIAKVMSKIEQEVSGATVIKTYVQRREIDRREFQAASNEYVETNVEAERIIASVGPTTNIVRAIGIAIILFWGGILASSNIITVGTLVAFYGYLDMFFRPLQTIVIFYNTFQSALAASERIIELLKIEQEDKGGVYEIPIRGEIKFENIVFGYEEKIPVLRNVNLVVNPSETIVIAGPTGSGKSTLAKLLLRFYEPWKGRILIDGIDIRLFKLEYLRSAISYVPQEPIVFSGTVLENIVMANPKATRSMVKELIEQLGLEDIFSSLPKGLDTIVVEDGKNLSKGQRQIISLLRAIISNPKILVLDEATSSVDPETEARIYSGIKRLSKLANMTAIVIAHRLPTVAKVATKIYVLDNGRIIEAGTHRELIARNGLYKRLWIAQTV